MDEWWEIGQWKESKSGKKWFFKLGSAKPDEKTGGFVIFLDGLPIQDSAGRCMLNVQPQRERGAGGNFGSTAAQQRGPRRDPPGTGSTFEDDDFSDPIPF